MKHKITLWLLSTLLAACAPTPFGMGAAPKDSPLPFRKGFDDGCKTGLSGFGNSFYKSFYRFTKDFSYANEPLYQNGWTKGYSYCRGYAMRWTFEEWDKQ